MQVFIPKECLYKKKTDESWRYFKLHYSYHPLPGSVVALKIIAFILGTRRSSSVQFSHSVMSDSLQPHGPQHTSLPCPLPIPRAYTNSRPSSQWYHPTISSCHPLLLPPSIFPSIRVFSNESVLHIRWPKYWSFQLLISWLQSPFAVILKPKKIKSITVSIVSPSICHEVMGLNAREMSYPNSFFWPI